MRLHRTLLLCPALFALLLLSPLAQPAGGVATAQAATRGLDPGFGSGGFVNFEAPKGTSWVQTKVATDDRIYILAGSLLFAFESDGAPVAGFGLGGRLAVASAVGEGDPAELAIDSQGRLLLAGSAHPADGASPEAYVIRLLPDGSRDPSFGNGGEVDTDFGLPSPTAGTAPSVVVSSLAVDAQDRPVVAGSFGPGAGSCSYTETLEAPDRSAFLARLTATGTPDPSFAGTGFTALTSFGGISGMTALRGGNLAVFSFYCPTPPRFESRSSEYNVFTASGARSPLAWQVPLGFSYVAPVVEPNGRLVEIDSSPPAGEAVDAIARYRPDGKPDHRFGRHGRAVLRHKPHYAEALAVDAAHRPIIALSTKRILLRRYLSNGKVDRHFGPHGQLSADGKAPSTIALDPKGRIYTVSVSPDTAETSVQIARFVPGR
jgi:uncharacterized delta-60 repeat protein